MSHVDEGALHAYLDGALDEYPPSEAEQVRAHLDACAECAERLEQERRIRGDAHALLDLASPVVEMPSLEELRAYVRRTRKEKRGISRIQRLGWAASVVLALGAGWMLREGQLQTRALDVRQDRLFAPAGEVAAPARTAGIESDESATRAEEGGAGAASVGAAPFDAEPDVVVTRQAAPEEPAVLPSSAVTGARASTVAVGPEGAAGAEEERAGATASDEPEALEVAGETAEPITAFARSADLVPPADAPGDEAGEMKALEETVLDDLVADGDPAQAAETVAVASAPGSADPTAEDPEVAAEPATPSPAVGVVREERDEATERSREPTPQVTSALRNDSRTSLAPPAEGRSERDDSTAVEPRLAVPGHTVISVTNLGNGTTPWGVRVLQGLTGGDTFEVFHLEPGVDPSILPDPAPGLEQARMETARGWIVARGPLSRVELGDMLQRLFPEAP